MISWWILIISYPINIWPKHHQCRLHWKLGFKKFKLFKRIKSKTFHSRFSVYHKHGLFISDIIYFLGTAWFVIYFWEHKRSIHFNIFNATCKITFKYFKNFIFHNFEKPLNNLKFLYRIRKKTEIFSLKNFHVSFRFCNP